MRLRTIAFAITLVTVAAAGCIGGDDEGIPSNIQVDASSPVVSMDFAYDGQDVVEPTGAARLVADNASGTGSLEGNLTLEGDTIAFSSQTFSGDPDKPYQGNGVAQGITVHGDTGRAAPTLPELNLLTGTWGPVTVTANGEPLPDPLTGQQTLRAHTMLTDTGIRDDDSKQILTEDGSVYSPDLAGSGQSVQGDTEFIVEIFSDPSAPVFNDATVQDDGQMTPDSSNASLPFEIKATTATAEMNVTVSPASDVLPTNPSEVDVSLVSPSGTELNATTLGGAMGEDSVAWSLNDVPASGTYTIELQTDTAANWEAGASIDYPEPVFLLAVFEDVSFGPAGGEE